jgi:hypothetical protein
MLSEKTTMKKNLLLFAPIVVIAISSCTLARNESSGESKSIETPASSSYSAPANEYYLDKTTLGLKLGQKKELHVWREGYKNSVYGSNWRSADPSIVTVNAGGEVIGVGVVETMIYVDAGGITLKCKVTVTEGDYSLSENELIVVEGENIEVPVVYLDQKPVAFTVTWASSDPSIARVSGSSISGVKEGAAYIGATIGSKNLRARVTVLSKAKALFILQGGSLSSQDDSLYGFSGTKTYSSETFETVTTTSNSYSWFFYYDIGEDVFNIENAWEFDYQGQHKRCVSSITFSWGNYRNALFQSTYYPSYSASADYNNKMKVRFNPSCMTFNVATQAVTVDESYTYTALHNDFQQMDSYDFAFMWHAVEKANEFAANCLATNSKISSYGLKLFQ